MAKLTNEEIKDKIFKNCRDQDRTNSAIEILTTIKNNNGVSPTDKTMFHVLTSVFNETCAINAFRHYYEVTGDI
jgi:hypothetical protein